MQYQRRKIYIDESDCVTSRIVKPDWRQERFERFTKEAYNMNGTGKIKARYLFICLLSAHFQNIEACGHRHIHVVDITMLYNVLHTIVLTSHAAHRYSELSSGCS
jgi:hypothetical protein